MRRYLICDDNRALAENLAEILVDQGDEVTLAPAGPDALRFVRALRFDAVITDLRMPVMNGAQLVHEIRRIDPGLPAIVITAYGGEEDLLAARNEGLLGVLPKPVPIPRLLELLAHGRRDGLVALVEDDEALADNVSELLRERGFSVVAAHSLAALERISGVRPFAGIADLRVRGGADGAALTRLLAGHPGLPTLVITAFASACPLPAQTRVFEKPFESRALLAAIEELYAGRGR